jgi:death on curing protein
MAPSTVTTSLKLPVEIYEAAAAARPGTVVFGQVAYPTLFGKAAALLFSVCQNHPLLDGDRRLAWSAAVTLLALNGVPVPDVDVDAAEAFMLSIAKGELTEVAQIQVRLRALYPS